VSLVWVGFFFFSFVVFEFFLFFFFFFVFLGLTEENMLSPASTRVWWFLERTVSKSQSRDLHKRLTAASHSPLNTKSHSCGCPMTSLFIKICGTSRRVCPTNAETKN